MMKIGIDAKSLSKRHTGIAVYVREIISWMQKADDENQYYLFSNADFHMPEEWHKCRKVIYKSHLPGSITVCCTLDKLIKKLNIDLFWGPEHCVPLKKSDYYKAVTIHDLSVILNPKWGTYYNGLFQRIFIAKCVRASDAVIAISESTRRDIIRICNCNEDKIHVIYNGDSPYRDKHRVFTEKEKQKIIHKFGIEKNYFLYCGTIEPRKNITTIVRAFDRLKSMEKSELKLVLCGGLGWKYQPILKRIEMSGFRQDIILTDYVSEEEKEYLYRNATALLFPSHYEGLGFPILEAMSCGTPVITARNSSLPEAGGDAAFYIDDENDYRQMAGIMKQIMNYSDAEKEDIDAKGRLQAAKFSRKECAKKTLRIFRQGVKNKTAGF